MRQRLHIVSIVILLLAFLVPAAQAQETGEVAAPNLNEVTIGFALFERAETARSTGDYRRAELDFSLFLLLNPTFSPAYYYRGQTYIALGQPDRARGDFDQALETSEAFTDTFVAEVLTARGVIQLSDGDYADARADLDRAITLNETNSSLYLYRAVALGALGENQDAAADILTFLEGNERQGLTTDPFALDEIATLEMAPGQVHRLRFEVERGQTIDVLVAPSAGRLNPLLVLVGPDGEALTIGLDSTTVGVSTIEDFEAPSGGTYTLVVGQAFGASDGALQVGVRVSDQ